MPTLYLISNSAIICDTMNAHCSPRKTLHLNEQHGGHPIRLGSGGIRRKILDIGRSTIDRRLPSNKKRKHDSATCFGRLKMDVRRQMTVTLVRTTLLPRSIWYPQWAANARGQMRDFFAISAEELWHFQ